MNKSLYSGHDSMAGQFGSMLIPIDEGENGRYTAAEFDNLASETAIVKRYQELSKLTLTENIDRSMRLLVFNAQNGDETALQAFREASGYLGRGLAYVNKAFAPEKIFVAGKITQLWDTISPVLVEEFDRFSHDYSLPAKNLLVPSSLVWASFEGATAMILQDVFASYKIVYRHPTWSNWAEWRWFF